MKADALMFEGNLALNAYLRTEVDKPVFTVIDGAKNTEAYSVVSPTRNPCYVDQRKSIARLAVVAALCVFTALSTALILRSCVTRVSLYNLQTVERTVEDGESLWGIAASLNIDSCDTEDVVDRIMELNDLDSSTLTPGQSLTVPTRAQ